MTTFLPLFSSKLSGGRPWKSDEWIRRDPRKEEMPAIEGMEGLPLAPVARMMWRG